MAKALVLIAMLAGATADPTQIDNTADDLFDDLYNRELTASQAQDAGLDGTVLGKSTLSVQPTVGQPARLTTPVRAPSARLPMVSTQAMMQPKFPAPLSMEHGGMCCRQAVVRDISVNAATKGKGKKKGVKTLKDGREVPFNLFMPKAPLKAKVVKNEVYPQTLTENTGDPNWETVHVTFETNGQYPYAEGMSLGLISPGPDKTGKSPAAVRLYSIASSAVGDNEKSNTVSLCVKRVVEVDGKFANREVGEDKADKAGTKYPENKVYRGVASNYICDLNVGDEVQITGPVGTEMLLPKDLSAPIIMLATGTGIAPMRSYLRYLFNDKAGANPDGSRKFTGLAWLFLGVPFSKSLLYDDENQWYTKNFPNQFRYEYAISREQKNAAGQKMYIQTRLAEYAEEVYDLLMNSKAHLYVCGLKGMESGMAEALGPIAEKNGKVWADLVKEFRSEGRWHVEVY